MITKDEATEGAQIAYVPTHAEGDMTHPDVEFGFITSLHPHGKGAFCRYWSKIYPGLRTVANSELTSFDDLVLYISRPVEEVEQVMERVIRTAFAR